MSLGGTRSFKILQYWLKRFPAGTYNYCPVHVQRDQSLWTLDLLDMETYIHTLPRLSRGAIDFEIWASLIKPGMTVVDIGANAGMYTFAAARATGPTGSIHAFEPQPRLFLSLDDTRKRQDCSWVVLHNIGLSDYQGYAQFNASSLASGVGRLVEPNTKAEACALITVTVNTLDAICDSHNLRSVDLIKLDVEGEEYKVLRGAARLLERDQPLLWLEWSPAAQQRAGISFPLMIRYLQGFGYVIFRRIAEDWPRLDETMMPERLIDFLAVPRRRAGQCKQFVEKR